MRPNSWFVVTGGPSTGKTTLLDALAELGYITVPEAARLVIDEGIAAGLTIEQIRGNEKQFQHDVLARKIEIEQGLISDQITLLDRGIHDNIAYSRLYDMAIEDAVIAAADRARYQKVFLLSPLSIYEADYARIESEETAHKLHGLLHDAYAEYDMRPVLVPALSIEERVKFVLQHINEPPTLGVA